MFGLMCRLDRHARNLDNLFVLEVTARSDLMFPHVAAMLRELKLLGTDVGPGITSSTNVAILHQIFLSLGSACKSRAKWVAEVTTAAQQELQRLRALHPDARTRNFLAAVQEQLDVYTSCLDLVQGWHRFAHVFGRRNSVARGLCVAHQTQRAGATEA